MNSKQAKRLRAYVRAAHPELTWQEARSKYHTLKKLHGKAVRQAGYEMAAARVRTLPIFMGVHST